jgi:hypothetical protein
MKEIKARVERIGVRGDVVLLSIEDHDAMMACLHREWTGWSPEECLRKANKVLNVCGYNAVLA